MIITRPAIILASSSIRCITIFFVLTLLAASAFTAQSRGRRFTTTCFENSPLTIIDVRNLNSENWPNDLEIEVKNNSSKPIYHVTIMLSWQMLLGEGWGLNLRYGDSRLVSSRIAGPEEEFIRPGESYVFTITKNKCKDCGVPRVEGVSRVWLNLSVVAFGDKTGYMGGRAYKGDEK